MCRIIFLQRDVNKRVRGLALRNPRVSFVYIIYCIERLQCNCKFHFKLNTLYVNCVCLFIIINYCGPHWITVNIYNEFVI